MIFYIFPGNSCKRWGKVLHSLHKYGLMEKSVPFFQGGKERGP